MSEDRKAPDWPPASSAWLLPEGTRRYGSTGQLWVVRDRRWVRFEPPQLVNGGAGDGQS